jgi:hypothetical protein
MVMGGRIVGKSLSVWANLPFCRPRPRILGKMSRCKRVFSRGCCIKASAIRLAALVNKVPWRAYNRFSSIEILAYSKRVCIAGLAQIDATISWWACSSGDRSPYNSTISRITEPPYILGDRGRVVSLGSSEAEFDFVGVDPAGKGLDDPRVALRVSIST